jgi:hypothetical protein
VKFDTGEFMKICGENPNLVETGQNIGSFTGRFKKISLIPAT